MKLLKKMLIGIFVVAILFPSASILAEGRSVRTPANEPAGPDSPPHGRDSGRQEPGTDNPRLGTNTGTVAFEPTAFKTFFDFEQYYFKKYKYFNVEITDNGPAQYHLFPPYSDSSRAGYQNIEIKGEPYAWRIRKAVLYEANHGDLYDIKRLVHLIPGLTQTTTTSVTTTRSTSTSLSVGYSQTSGFQVNVGKLLNFSNSRSIELNMSTTYSHSKSFTVQEGTSFSWHENYNPAKSVTIYVGMTADRYELTLDFVPWQRGFYDPEEKNKCVTSRENCKVACGTNRTCIAECLQRYRDCMDVCPYTPAYWDYGKRVTQKQYLDIPEEAYATVFNY